jgi:hypothetical protein
VCVCSFPGTKAELPYGLGVCQGIAAMSPFFSLILGHLIGDFVLQTIDLVRLKGHSWKGLLLHSGIVVVSCGLCLWSNFPTWWPWLIPLFLLHVGTDWAKVALSRRVTGWKTRFFFLDQAAHLAVSVLVILLQAGGWPYHSLADAIGAGAANRNLVFLAAFIIAFFVVPLLEAQAAYALTRHVPKQGGDGNGNGVAATMPDRLWGGAERALVLLLLYIGPPAIWFAPLAFIPRVLSLWPAWKQPKNARVYRAKIATSILCMVVLGVVIWFMQPYLG